MATDVETLLARIEVQTSKFERQMERARSNADRNTAAIERRFAEANKSLSRAFDGVSFDGLASGARGAVAALGPLAGALTGVLSVEGFRQAADTYTRTINALKVAGLEGAELTQVYGELFGFAQRQGAPLEQLSRLYGQLSQAQGDLKVSSQEILGVVEATGQALRVSGVPAAQASGAILGLSQALSGGTVRAEEFNQMLEGGLRPALQAAALGLEEAGGSVGRLRQLVVDGEVSSRAFFAAIQAGQPALQQLADTAEGTTSQALERLKNEMINLTGEIDSAAGVSRAFIGVLSGMATGAGQLAEAVRLATPQLRTYINVLKEMMGISTGAFNGTARKFEPIIETSDGRRYGGGIDQDWAEAERERARGAGFSRVRSSASVRPVSLRQFPTGDDDEATGGGGRAAQGRAQRISDYEREVQALNKRTEALNLDISTFGQSAEAISRAKVEQQLLNALQKDGVTVSAEQRVKIGELAQAYADTEARLKSMKDAQAAQNELTRFAGQSVSSFFSDVVSGGKNAEQALMNLTKRLAEAALQAVLLGDGPLGRAFGLAGRGGAAGGLLGGLFRGITSLFGFSEGGYTGGGARGQVAGVVHGGEYVFSKAAVEKLGVSNLEAMHRRARGFASGGYVGAPAMPRRVSGGGKDGGGVTIVQQISANGDRTVAEIARRAAAEGIANYDRSLPLRMNNFQMRGG